MLMKDFPFPYERVLVTGSTGFLGGWIVEKLRQVGVEPIVAWVRPDLTQREDVQHMIKHAYPDLIINCAAKCGGIGLNDAKPGYLFDANLQIGFNVMQMSRYYGVKKVVNIGTICSYPAETSLPFSESDLWDGFPEETNAYYGMAKKMVIVQSMAYRKQWGFNSINLLLANLYGPRDHFDLDRGHVIPAIIEKCRHAIEHGESHIMLWGTGLPTRDFLYVEDAAEGVIRAAGSYDSSAPVNLGTGCGTSIRSLSWMIAEMMGFKGEILWNTSRPDGQMCRQLDIEAAEAGFGWWARTGLDVGLKRTIDWYLENRKA